MKKIVVISNIIPAEATKILKFWHREATEEKQQARIKERASILLKSTDEVELWLTPKMPLVPDRWNFLVVVKGNTPEEPIVEAPTNKAVAFMYLEAVRS